MTTFRDLIRKLGPPWLTRDQTPDPDGGTVETDSRVLTVISIMFDGFGDRLRNGIRARFPGLAPEDALGYIGRDRRITRGPDESSAAFEVRLRAFLDGHRKRGSAWAMAEQLRGYCSPHAVRVRVVNEHGTMWTTERDGTLSVDRGTAWSWDGTGLVAGWARFWVIIYPTVGPPTKPWQIEGQWGDGTTKYGDGGTIGTTATPGDVKAIRKIVQEWKPAGSLCVHVIIAFDDASFAPAQAAPPLPGGGWADYADNGTPYVKARLDTARYWKGTLAT